ncbi:hypothetical protein KI688_006828 [Linnemannia hyalina]|uniref:Uncharacterized protein n=1 Tax=Linnemannia hyalina TaxID=64524 RepID=A0A9P7XJL5_9FUNG|nr:hypothetical protein KI688_006828 [Linnemannia hyalina]
MATGRNNSNNNTAEKSAAAALTNAHHYAQQQFIIKGHPYPSLSACAKAFYNQFSFKDHGSATDSFRASLRAIQKKHDWAAELLKNTDSAEFRKEEKLLHQSADRLTRKRSHTIAGFADKQSDRLVRDTLVTNTTILREGNRILGDLTIGKLSSIQTHAEQMSSSSSLRLKTPSISSESEEDNRSSIPFPRAPAGKDQPPVMNPSYTGESPLKDLVTLKEDPAEEQTKFKETVGAFGCLNQPTTWKSADGTIDLLSTFTSFLARRPRGPFIEHEYVADLSEGASFLNSLSREEFSAALESQPATPLLVTNWSTVMEVFDRVLAPEFGFEEAYLAARKESMLDPVAEFVHSVLYSFGTYLQVDKSIPHSLNEREAFADITWPIIRGALRLAGIASRYLEVPIQGVDERKNAHRNLINESKAHTHFADGVGLLDGGQAYLAEASVLFSPDPRKRHIDEYKLKRALRDTLISQIRRIAEESVPPSGTSVFGSTSFADKTKYYRLDFCGAFRLVQVGSMTVPITDSNFGGRMRRCLTSALEFAALIMQEKKQREGARDATMKERHEFARACTKIVRTTTSPAAKTKKSQE